MRISILTLLSMIAIATEGIPLHDGNHKQNYGIQNRGEDDNNIVVFNEDMTDDYGDLENMRRMSDDEEDPIAEVVMQFMIKVFAVNYGINGTVISNVTFERNGTAKSFLEISNATHDLYVFYFLSFYPGATNLIVPTPPPYDNNRGAAVYESALRNATNDISRPTSKYNITVGRMFDEEDKVTGGSVFDEEDNVTGGSVFDEEDNDMLISEFDEEDRRARYSTNSTHNQQNLTETLFGMVIYFNVEINATRNSYNGTVISRGIHRDYNVSNDVYDSYKVVDAILVFADTWFNPFERYYSTPGPYDAVVFKKAIDDDLVDDCNK